MSSASIFAVIGVLLQLVTSSVAKTKTPTYTSPPGLFISEIINEKVAMKWIEAAAKADHERMFDRKVFRQQTTWIEVNDESQSFLMSFKAWWRGKKNWENRRIIRTTDGLSRRAWLHNYTRLPETLTNLTEGRIRFAQGNIYFRSIKYKDIGVYSCLEINEKGIQVTHINVHVLRFENSWIDFHNPNALFKWALIGTMLIYVVFAWYQFTTFDRLKAREFAERMEATVSSQALADMVEARNRRAMLYEAGRLKAVTGPK